MPQDFQQCPATDPPSRQLVPRGSDPRSRGRLLAWPSGRWCALFFRNRVGPCVPSDGFQAYSDDNLSVRNPRPPAYPWRKSLINKAHPAVCGRSVGESCDVSGGSFLCAVADWFNAAARKPRLWTPSELALTHMRGCDVAQKRSR
jgi:hypothetical protein